jgi:hypothetical protein
VEPTALLEICDALAIAEISQAAIIGPFNHTAECAQYAARVEYSHIQRCRPVSGEQVGGKVEMQSGQHFGGPSPRKSVFKLVWRQLAQNRFDCIERGRDLLEAMM